MSKKETSESLVVELGLCLFFHRMIENFDNRQIYLVLLLTMKLPGMIILKRAKKRLKKKMKISLI